MPTWKHDKFALKLIFIHPKRIGFSWINSEHCALFFHFTFFKLRNERQILILNRMYSKELLEFNFQRGKSPIEKFKNKSVPLIKPRFLGCTTPLGHFRNFQESTKLITYNEKNDKTQN